MSGSWINQKQGSLYMSSRFEGDSQERAASRSGFSERSGRRIEKGTGGPNHRKTRVHRTRKDPLEAVWTSELVPMLEHQPALKAITLFEYIQRRYPEQYPDSIRRTLERRVKLWRSVSGPEKEIIFCQSHQPGLMGISDFTEPKDSFHITIRGKALAHILFHFRLPFSGWAYVRVIEGGESFIALSSSLNDALQRLGGAPKTHRTDSLSAAYKNLNKDEQEDTTKRYQEFCDHYSMKATRNNRGVSHENGAIESPHGHLKQRIGQALMLRGSSDFDSVESYNHWLSELVSRLNRRRQDKINEERATLTPLPASKTLTNFEFTAEMTPYRARIEALLETRDWVGRADNLLLFGPSGVGKTHLAAAIGHGLIEQGIRVRHFSAVALVQMLQSARNELRLDALLHKLDKYAVIIVDDIGYVRKSEAETHVLFELISYRYESGSLIVTSNQPFSQWDQIFADSSMTVAAVDRLVHHSIIIDIQAESFRKCYAQSHNA